MGFDAGPALLTLQNHSYDGAAVAPHGRSRISDGQSVATRSSNALIPAGVTSSIDWVIFTSLSSTARKRMVTVKGSSFGSACSGTL